jgi:hypothetical protein
LIMAVNQVAISEAGNVQLSVEGAQETQIVLAAPGVQGPVGPGVPSGGTTNQVLFKTSAADYDTAWSEVTSSMIGDLEIVNADVATNAAIALSKLATGALPSGITVDSLNIVDGTIVDADINASAAIADTKLATISTAGKVNNSATTATSANTVSAIVARDASGNFTAGTITAALTGNASTATKLSSDRTFALTGDITGTVSSDLTSGASITSSIASGVIVDADVNASAAIAGTKINPNFGTQNITTSGDINLDDGGSFQTTLQLVTPTAARTITFPDATGTVGLVAGSSGQLVFNSAGAYSGLSGVTTDGTDVTLTGRFISSLNGAASAPPGTFTGTWFTGGTATTTKPQVLIEPTGTTSTAWSTSGTGLGVNAASGFGGRLLDLQTNGTSRAVVTGAGLVGIGTSAPGALLETSSNASGTLNGEVLLQRIRSNPGSNIAFLDIKSRRHTAGPDWNGVGFRLQHQVDSTPMGFIEFNSIDNSQNLALGTGGNSRLLITSAGNVGIGTTSPSSLLHLADAGNISVGTTTGTKIGTATTQKLGFYNATPVVQPAAVADATDAATVITQLNDLLAKLRTLGIIAT